MDILDILTLWRFDSVTPLGWASEIKSYPAGHEVTDILLDTKVH
jgi:hypothetical protein